MSSFDISEKYRKFLLGVVFGEQTYYTVSGADLSDNYVDKVLVDGDGSWLLFSSPEAVLSVIQKNNSFFDKEALQQWARGVADINELYATISFDVLGRSNLDIADIELFYAIYDTIGIVEDYSIQVADQKLRPIFENDILSQFKDDLADYFIWTENEFFKVSVDIDILSGYLKGIYERLKVQVRIYQ